MSPPRQPANVALARAKVPGKLVSRPNYGAARVKHLHRVARPVNALRAALASFRSWAASGSSWPLIASQARVQRAYVPVGRLSAVTSIGAVHGLVGRR